MVCEKCGKMVPDGQEYCVFCGIPVKDGDLQDDVVDESVSKCGNAIKVLAVLLMILGCIGSVAFGIKLGGAYLISSLLIVFIVGMMCYGVGEICCLLKSIDSKLK